MPLGLRQSGQVPLSTVLRKSAECSFTLPIFGYQLPTLNNKELKAGNYHLNMTVKGDNGSWKFDKLFTVTDKDGKAAKIAKPATNWKQIIMWVIEGLAILIVLAYIINKFRKWIKKD